MRRSRATQSAAPRRVSSAARGGPARGRGEPGVRMAVSQATAPLLTAWLLCGSTGLAQQDSGTTVYADPDTTAMLASFGEGTPQYEMLLERYQTSIADASGLNWRDVTVCCSSCPCKASPPAPPPVVRPGTPQAPASSAQVQNSMTVTVNDQYHAALTQAGSDEQLAFARAFQESTAAQLSTCGVRRPPDTPDCSGCPAGTCLSPDNVEVDMQSLLAPSPPPAPGTQQTMSHEMSVDISDEYARTLCEGPGNRDYDRVSLLMRQAVATYAENACFHSNILPR